MIDQWDQWIVKVPQNYKHSQEDSMCLTLLRKQMDSIRWCHPCPTANNAQTSTRELRWGKCPHRRYDDCNQCALFQRKVDTSSFQSTFPCLQDRRRNCSVLDILSYSGGTPMRWALLRGHFYDWWSQLLPLRFSHVPEIKVHQIWCTFSTILYSLLR